MGSQNPLLRVFLNACYNTPFFNAGQNTCLKKVCQRHFSFDVSMHKSDSDAHSLTCCFETVMKNKEKKEKTKKKRKTMIKEYTYKKRKRGEDYAIQALILFVPKTEIS